MSAVARWPRSKGGDVSPSECSALVEHLASILACSVLVFTGCSRAPRADKQEIADKQELADHELFQFIRVGDEATISSLLEKQPELHSLRDQEGHTALHIAIGSKSVRIVSLLLEAGADVNALGGYGMSPMGWAVAGDDVAMIDLILASGKYVFQLNESGDSPIHSAVRDGQLVCVRRLLAGGVPADAVNDTGDTLLHSAAAGAQLAALTMLLEETSLESAINDQNVHGWTPLHRAAIAGNAKIARTLLQFGADPSLPDNRNRTAMDFAVTEGNDELILLLKGDD